MNVREMFKLILIQMGFKVKSFIAIVDPPKVIANKGKKSITATARTSGEKGTTVIAVLYCANAAGEWA